MKTEKIFILIQILVVLETAKYATIDLIKNKNIKENEKLINLSKDAINDLLIKYFENDNEKEEA